MKTMKQIKKYMAIGAGAGALVLAAPMASAATLSLCAGSLDKLMSDGVTTVPMWAFGEIDPGTGACSLQVPGPEITVPAGDPVLEVTLRNDLGVPVSLIIQGQALPVAAPGAVAPSGPVFNVVNGQPTRVRSLVHEAAPGSTATYIWNNIKPGSHVYHSATHQQVQVQMGLYGAMIRDQAAGVAYAESFGSVAYQNAVNLFLSEIDPALHARVAATDFAAMGQNIQLPLSTLDYQPKFSLVNGEAVDVAAPALTTGSTGADLQGGTDILVRMFNAGLKSHYPQSLGGRMKLVAENGYMLRYPQDRVSVPVHPLGTTDAIVRTPLAGGNISIVDRRLHLNDGSASRGMVSKLSVAANAGPMVADDVFAIVEDSPATALAVLGNDFYSGLPTDVSIVIEEVPQNGLAMVVGSAISYTPNANFFGSDSLAYSIVDATGVHSDVANVDITVNPVNDDAPTTVDDVYTAYVGQVLNVPAPGVLANDFDVDGESLQVTAMAASGAFGETVAFAADGSFSLNPGTATATDTLILTYQVSDGVNTAAGSVTINMEATAPVIPLLPPVAVEDTFSYSRGANTLDLVTQLWSPMDIAIVTGLLANDEDPDNGAFPAGEVIDVLFGQVIATSDILDPNDGVTVIGTRVQISGLTQMNGSTIILENELDLANNIVGQTLTYTPILNGLGTDEFMYQVIDADGNVSNSAIVRINIVE